MSDTKYVLVVRNTYNLAVARLLDSTFGKYTKDLERTKIFPNKESAEKWKTEYDRKDEVKPVTYNTYKEWHTTKVEDTEYVASD